jgi:hydrogenase maturation protease
MSADFSTSTTKRSSAGASRLCATMIRAFRAPPIFCDSTLTAAVTVPDDHPRHIVIGVGNPYCGDDAAGRMVVRRVAGALPGYVEIAELDGEATSIVAQLQGAQTAIIVDACASGASVGTVLRFDAAAGPLPQETFGVSTHGFGLADAVELTRALGELPAYCVVYAIEGKFFEAGTPPSPQVAAAVEEVARRLCTEFDRLEASVRQSHA